MGLLRLWRHECLRVFQDKLVNVADKELVKASLDATVLAQFGEEAHTATSKEVFFADFFRDDKYDADGVRDARGLPVSQAPA